MIYKIGLLIFRDKTFLINRKKGTSLFLLPGGKPENGETDIVCLGREIREEHDCEIIEDSLSYFGDFEDVSAEGNDIVHIKVYRGNIKGNPTPSSEIVEQKWFGKNDDVSILSPIILNKILPEIERKRLM